MKSWRRKPLWRKKKNAMRWLFGILSAVFAGGGRADSADSGVPVGKESKKKEIPQEIHLPDHIYELPEDMTPAVMNGAVFSGNVQAADISATILDLVRKGYLTISPVQIPQKGIFGREKAPEDSFR